MATSTEQWQPVSHSFNNGSNGSHFESPVDNELNGRINGHNGLETQGKKLGHRMPIAVIGMGMRLPGGIKDSESFWKFLMDKKEGMIPIPTSRWNPAGFHDPKGKLGTVRTNEGNFLGDLDPAAFDVGFFSQRASQVEQVDPQQRLLLETAYEALENAGIKDFKGSNIGVYAGAFSEDWIEMHAKNPDPPKIVGSMGHLDFMASNLISYEFDLRGPSMTFKTGCSAALVAMDTACKALSSGDCEAAVVGVTNLILSPGMSTVLGSNGMTSADGRSRPFDADGIGYGRAEAVSSLIVKRLDDALRDGNPVRAIIKSTMCNGDGKTLGIPRPSADAHEALIRAAYAAAGIPEDRYKDTAYFECHGTGTEIGDPIEVEAVARVFGRDGIIIGSVKSNVGHSGAASGNTSMIKAILALEHRTIPPNVNFKTPNPKMPWTEAKLSVLTEPTEFPADRAERVSVNSFGIGGSNAHVILDSAASYGIDQAAQHTSTPRLSLLLFSAKSESSLDSSTRKHSKYIESHGPSCLGDMAYTLATRRQHYEYRSFAVSYGDEPLTAQPPVRTKNIERPLVFVFTGQGAQWAEMGSKLIADFPRVRSSIEEMDEVLSTCHTPPTWKIMDELTKSEPTSQISKAEFSQPLCTAIQVALVDLLKSWGVEPSAVIGHSSGEIAAAYSTGGITKKEAILAAYFRGHVTRSKLKDGGMAAIGLGAHEVRPQLVDGLVIACENSPNSTTVSGDRDALEIFIGNIKRDRPDVFIRALKVDNAYHSHHMKTYGETYEIALKDIVACWEPRIPLFSTVTGKQMKSRNIFTPSYWRNNLESPVLFHSGVRNLIGAGFKNAVYLEIGPHSALAGPLRQIFQAEDIQLSYVSTLQRGQDDSESIYTAIGNLWRNNIPIDFDAMNPKGSVLTNLPTYSWDHTKSYWNESRLSREWRMRKFPPHDILGVQLPGSSHLEPTWRNLLRLDQVGWIRDHQLGTDIVFPAVGYVAMAGEAIRQLTGRSDYSVRSVSLRAAMIVSENDVITTFRKAKLTDTSDSDWWDFRITSFNGSTWSEHCSGQVKSGPIRSLDWSIWQPDYLRKVSAKRWYTAMQKIGFVYGPSFQGLRDISTDPATKDSVANIENAVPGPNDSFYELHPCTLDKLLQLMSVTQHEGHPFMLKQLRVPTYISEMYVSGGMRELRATSSSHKDFQGTEVGDGYATADGKIVFDMRGLSTTFLDNEREDANKSKNTVQLVWEPDFRFMDAKDLIKSTLDSRKYFVELEKYCFLVAKDTIKTIEHIETTQTHLIKFRSWMKDFVESVARGEDPFIPDGNELDNLSDPSRQVLAQKIADELEASPVKCVSTAIRRVQDSAKARFEGTADTLEILMEDNILTEIYAILNSSMDYTPLLRSLGHCKPTMRVLEIGAGTGGTTTSMLASLKSKFAERLYAKYTYTDVSAGFFIAAKERFQSDQNIEFSVLDISKDPLKQGFKEESFDLILAANVIHATPSLNESLINVKKLLHPKGRLLIQELDTNAKVINFVMGGLSSWWLGEIDGRMKEPYVSSERWDRELRSAGFDGIDALAYDNDIPYQITNTMLSSVVQPKPEKKKLTLLYRTVLSPAVESFKFAFEDFGYRVDMCAFGSDLPPKQDIVSLLELEAPFFHRIVQEDFERWMKVASGIDNVNTLWITRSAQMHTKDPRYGQVLGFARTLRSERHTSFTTLEIDDIKNPSACLKSIQVFEQIGRGDNDPELDPDFEFVLSEDVIYSSRYHWIDIKEELIIRAGNPVDKVLRATKKGKIDGLQFEESKGMSRPLKGQEVAIMPHTVGVSYEDVLQAEGLIESDDLGGECSGTIEAVGPDVTDFKPGDKVFAMVSRSFSNRVLATAELVAKIPDGLKMEEAATMPIAFITVIYALVHLRRMQKGETILIHSAAGSIGISAIQVAKMLGASIFATVDNEEKAKFLMENFDIPREQILDSSNSNFDSDVLKATNGHGVDVALNSLSGEHLHSTWACIAPFGTMIEIGKRDFYGHARLDMMNFTENRAFVGLDTRHMEANRPALCGQILRECAQYFCQGHIRPIQPILQFKATEIGDAFRYIQEGDHIGKPVVCMSDDLATLPCAVRAPNVPIRNDSSILLVGGFGGVGRSIAGWLVRNGSKHLTFLSRSGSSESSKDFVQELEVLGCKVQIFKGSVANLSDVSYMVANTEKPIRGVIQLSMVLQDRAIDAMTYEDWNAAIYPKVNGTWNLHNALGNDLDFFVLFSSISGLAGLYGQANYASANTFLDAFVQYRHSKGLAASVIDLGVMEDVGFVSESAGLIDYFKSISSHVLSEEELWDSVMLAITRSLPESSTPFASLGQFGVGVGSHLPLTDPVNRIIWKGDRRFSVYRNIGSTQDATATTDDGLRSFLSKIASTGAGNLGDDEVEYLAMEIGKTLYGFMMKDLDEIDLHQPLTSIGLDSLLSMELRNWCRQQLGVEISILEIMQSTLVDLGKKTVDALVAKYS